MQSASRLTTYRAGGWMEPLGLGLHVFMDGSAVLVTWTFIFFVFAAMTMIFLHAQEWVESAKHL